MTDTADTWLAEGEVWMPDAHALCARHNIAYLNLYDGNLYAGIPGRGEVPLAELLAQEGRPEVERGTVATFKPAPR